jgi:hypothetical protein
VKGHHRRLDEEPGRQQAERHHHQPIRRLARQRLADLRQIQRPRAPVHQRDAREDEKRADRVGDREVQRPLHRLVLVDLVARERVRRDAHQLEEDEHVEQIAREAEADHPAEKQQHQRLEVGRIRLPVAPHQDQRRHHQHRAQRRQPGAEGVDDERHADSDSAVRLPATEPVDLRAGGGPRKQNRAERDHGHRGAERHHLGYRPVHARSDGGQQPGRQQRHGDRERCDVHAL